MYLDSRKLTYKTLPNAIKAERDGICSRYTPGRRQRWARQPGLMRIHNMLSMLCSHPFKMLEVTRLQDKFIFLRVTLWHIHLIKIFSKTVRQNSLHCPAAVFLLYTTIRLSHNPTGIAQLSKKIVRIKEAVLTCFKEKKRFFTSSPLTLQAKGSETSGAAKNSISSIPMPFLLHPQFVFIIEVRIVKFRFDGVINFVIIGNWNAGLNNCKSRAEHVIYSVRCHKVLLLLSNDEVFQSINELFRSPKIVSSNQSYVTSKYNYFAELRPKIFQK